jgi:hypothetical protein
MSPRVALGIAQGLGALLVVVLGCASPPNPSYESGARPCQLDPRFYASCAVGRPGDCEKNEDCAKVGDVGPVCVPRGCACRPVSATACDPAGAPSGCGPSEVCLTLGDAGPACVSSTCACEPIHEIVCDPMMSPSGCGPNEACLVYEESSGATSARCTPYSCGVCDGEHPCVADPSKPFCHRPRGQRPRCEGCGGLRGYSACDPLFPKASCLPDEVCLEGLVDVSTPVCVPQACRCSIGSRSTCDPTSPHPGCLPDEGCFDPRVGTAGPPGCLANQCFPCDGQRRCENPAFPFCKRTDSPVGRCRPCPTDDHDYSSCDPSRSTDCFFYEACEVVDAGAPAAACVPQACGGHVVISRDDAGVDARD